MELSIQVWTQTKSPRVGLYVFINYMQLEVSGEALMDGSSWLISRVVGGGPNAMHQMSLESLEFRNLNVNTTDYCYRQYNVIPNR